MSEYFRPWNIDQTLLLPPNVHLEALGALFLQVLKLCETAGLVKLGHVALDGTKIKANASIIKR
jgi:hypothetical protein